ncbi:MAG: transcription antiterminator [Sporolactobacillus sp.]
MNRRHRDIINLILNTEGYLTGNELARLCHVTIRTIRKDIKEINDLLKEYDMEIDSSIKKGYFLNEKNKSILKKNNIIRKVLDYEYIIETPNLPLDRQVYILSKLTTQKCISLEELTKSLYVSEATVNNDCILINKWLKKHLRLGISYSLNEGMMLKANEREKRNIISWILAIKLNVSTVAKYWNYLFDDKDMITEARSLYRVLSVETKKYGYHLSGHSYQLLSYEILVAVKRRQMGFNLINSENRDSELMEVISNISEKVKRKLAIDLPKVEWLDLQQRFKSKQFLYGTDINKIETDEAIRVVDQFFDILRKKYQINLTGIPENKYKLILYSAPMINRSRYRHCIPNQIDEKMVKIYKTEFKMAAEMINIIKKDLNLEIEPINLAYITIHLVAMCGLRRFSLNTIIVCDYDESIISFIQDKIKNIFGEKITIGKFYDYQEFMNENKENLIKVDLIITTSTIADLTDIPFVRINAEFDQNDIDTITTYIDNFRTNLIHNP